jgi:hypothetical protein
LLLSRQTFRRECFRRCRIQILRRFALNLIRGLDRFAQRAEQANSLPWYRVQMALTGTNEVMTRSQWMQLGLSLSFMVIVVCGGVGMVQWSGTWQSPTSINQQE